MCEVFESERIRACQRESSSPVGLLTLDIPPLRCAVAPRRTLATSAPEYTRDNHSPDGLISHEQTKGETVVIFRTDDPVPVANGLGVSRELYS